MKNTSGGGKNTNKNGLRFEEETSLDDCLVRNGYKVQDNNVYNRSGKFVGKSVNKHSFYTRFLDEHQVNYKDINSKKWLPDDCFVNEEEKTVYIIEKKFQNSSGSVDEKLPNCGFKKMEYEKLVNSLGYNVEFIYVLSDWFKRDEYKDTLDYVNYLNCSYYFNDIPLKAVGLN